METKHQAAVADSNNSSQEIIRKTDTENLQSAYVCYVSDTLTGAGERQRKPLRKKSPPIYEIHISSFLLPLDIFVCYTF